MVHSPVENSRSSHLLQPFFICVLSYPAGQQLHSPAPVVLLKEPGGHKRHGPKICNYIKTEKNTWHGKILNQDSIFQLKF